tara:strand:- start:306 stop:746 length:441 start_codon:yes stop_codon:yes gene_type:complete
MASFKSCLAFGKIYERETLKHIKYDTHEFSIGNCKEWDIKTLNDGVETYYEVKSEVNCFKYGNICVEYKCNNKDSGINATTADYWVHYAIKDKIKNIYDVRIIPVKELRQMITDKLYTRIVYCGDNNNSACYLFKMNLLDKYILPV